MMVPQHATQNLSSVKFLNIAEMFSTRSFQRSVIATTFLGSMLVTCKTAMPSAAIASETQFPFRSCHLEYRPTGSVRGMLTDTLTIPATFQSDTWTAYASYPPNCDSQNGADADLAVKGDESLHGHLIRERSQLQRAVLFLHFRPQNGAFDHQLTIVTRYGANLYSRDLVEGPPPVAIRMLSGSERLAALVSSEWLDWRSPAFQNWLNQTRLRKSPKESDIQFAWRAFLHIRASSRYWYEESQNRSISKLVAEQRTDCGGLCGLLVGTLRANQIPARMLFGKWAENEKEGENTIERSKNHVKAEFYARSVGWVPVEMSAAVLDKSAPGLVYFGHSAGNFITLHIDPDLILDTQIFGDKRVDGLQNSAIWFHGKGTGLDKVNRRFNWAVARR